MHPLPATGTVRCCIPQRSECQAHVVSRLLAKTIERFGWRKICEFGKHQLPDQTWMHWSPTLAKGSLFQMPAQSHHSKQPSKKPFIVFRF